jgi:O-antigen/teichoic acid export membrane protein
VADYSVVYRLFSIPAGLAVIALQPLWPAYREAISRTDMKWVGVTLRRSFLVTIVATVPLAIVLSIVGPAIVGLWTRQGLSPALGLYPALGAFTIAFGVANVFAMLLNGAQAMRFQVSTMVLMAVLNLAASIYLASRIGVAGVVLGSVFAVVVVLIVPAALYIPRMLRRLARDGSLKVGSIALDESLGLRS